ncbi:WD40 repeat domain-containing protein [Streptomyces sp. NBC_01481]|uniref:WD40 repeat domain-containing protein n=1 Tax=Streptomyces sp. NBC_01481 TaxID=2975869 RepID=UPI00225695D1|nr:WD40 repeat domain-containing protein [Streptomyces sp. NBC_01481]MCX4586296.1 WD40 repeat domain-containing protein [Streptomyces sp. NBC_01481]
MAGTDESRRRSRAGRPQRPVDPEAGPVQRLAFELRHLREKAGAPSYRSLAKTAHYSASTLAEAAKGDRFPTLEVTLAYVEACGGNAAQWEARWRAASSELAQSADGHFLGEQGSKCPYPGLAAFGTEDAEMFFGRDDLVKDLLEQIEQTARAGLLAVFGASGSGKSSLLRAGLLPALSPDMHPLLLTAGAHPLTELAVAVASLTGIGSGSARRQFADDQQALEVSLRTWLAGQPDRTRVVLVVDQFEEVFTLCIDAAERHAFLSAIADLARTPDHRIRTVIAVRADFYSHCSSHPELVAALRQGVQLPIGPPACQGLRDIIIEPAVRTGVSVDADLVATVSAEAADQPGALPLLAHVLREVWNRREGSVLRLVDYHASGGVRGAVAQTAERVHGELPPAQRQAARKIFLRLTALGDGTDDTRRPIARSELDGIADEPVVSDVLNRLAEARLVVLDEYRVQVAHEALIRAWPRLHRWLTDDRGSLLVHRRLTDASHTWELLERDAGALYRGTQLAVARSWAEDHPDELNQLESSFLNAGTAAEESARDSARRRARLLKRLVAAMSVLLLLALLGGGIAVRQRQDAQRQELVALSDQLSLQARSLLATDPDLAGLLAVEADHLHSDAETRGGVLSAAAAQRRSELNVGGQAVYSLAFSPDHLLLASAARDGTVSLWDPERRTRITSLTGHADRAMQVAFSADGTRLAASTFSGTTGTIAVWDARTHRLVTSMTEQQAGLGMAFSPDGRMIAVSVGAHGDIAVRDVSTGSRRLLRGHGRAVRSLTFSRDSRLLVSADGTGHPIVWNVASGEVLAELPAEHVASVVFGTSGSILAGAADDGGVHLWDLAGDRPVVLPSLPLQGSYGWSTSAPVGDRIAVADENGAVTLWDLRGRQPVQTFGDRGRTETASVALSQDGALLASAGFNGSIVLHDLRHPPFSGFDAQVNDIKVSPDGTVIASADSDGTVRLWDDQGHEVAALAGHSDRVQSVAFSPDGRLLAAVTRNNTVTLWDVRRRQRVTGPFPTTGLGASTDIAFGSSGRFLAAATLGAYVWDVHDVTSPSPLTLKDSATRFATSLVFTPDGRRLVTSNQGGVLNEWEVTTGKYLNRTDTHQGTIQDLAISPDGTLLATAGDSRTIKLWNAATHQQIAVLHEHTAPVQVLAFSRDGRMLASAGDDHTVIVWDVATRRRVATLTGHTARIRSLAFTPEGALLSGGEDTRIIRWSLDMNTARAHICATTGRNLTRGEWAAYLPSAPYDPHCAARLREGSAQE